MSEKVFNAFPPDAYGGPVWDLVRRHLSQAGRSGESLESVREELAVIELISRFGFVLDQGDLDGVMALLTDDCVVTNPRGTHADPAAIRADYGARFGDSARRFHLWTDVVVEFADDLKRAQAASRFLAVHEPAGGTPRLLGGVAFDEVVKTDDGWRFAARWTGVDFTTTLVTPG